MQGQNAIPPISIVIPTLNEEAHIATVLANIPPAPEVEILVVDGGSQDTTVDQARRCGVQVLLSPRGRARQMNAGAAIAKGEILLFLHADTRLPEAYDYYVRRILLQPDVAAGAFQLSIDSHSRGLRFIEKMANWRSRYLKMPYGDQAIFLRAAVFHEIGGFPEMPIMEDYEFMQRLQKCGQIVIAQASVLTSARRWQELGILRTTCINQAVIIGYSLGISPSRLAQWYRGKQKRK